MIAAAALAMAAAAQAVQPSAPTDAPAGAAPADAARISTVVATAVAACEDWILNPDSWTADVAQFPRKNGLADRGLNAVSHIPDVAMPAADLRRGLHHWRVAASDTAGVFVTTSDQLPVCHVAGGGPVDFEPGVEAALASDEFAKHWKAGATQKLDDLVRTDYVSLQNPRMTMLVSRAAQPNQRQDRVQFIATMQYRIGK